MAQAITIIFDGGSTCNVPRKGFGKGYGSFKVEDREIQRCNFGAGHSANSGEVRTLIEALRYTKKHFPEYDTLHIKGDSKIALSWIFRSGIPKPFKGKEPTSNFIEAVRMLHVETKGYNITTQWHPRKESVKLFGH